MCQRAGGAESELSLPFHSCRGGEPASPPSPELAPSSGGGRMESRGKDARGSSPSLTASSSSKIRGGSGCSVCWTEVDGDLAG